MVRRKPKTAGRRRQPKRVSVVPRSAKTSREHHDFTVPIELAALVVAPGILDGETSIGEQGFELLREKLPMRERRDPRPFWPSFRDELHGHEKNLTCLVVVETLGV